MYTLIPKTNLAPREPVLLFKPSYQEAETLLSDLDDGLPVSFDLETTGLSPRAGDIVSVGIATSKGCAAIDVRDPDVLNLIGGWLMERELYGFNMAFDGVWMATKGKAIPKIVGDTMVLFKLGANEGYVGQTHSLHDLIENVLGWPSSSKSTFGDILAVHGLKKSEMWKVLEVEPEAFLRYNALDAEAARQGMLYLREVLGKFDALLWTHDTLYTSAYRCYIEQHVTGLTIDVDGLEALRNEVEAHVRKWEREFEIHPLAKEYVEKVNKARHDEHFKPVVTTKKVWAKQADEPWNYPEDWTRCDKDKPAKWEIEKGSWYKTITTVKVSRKKSAAKTFGINSPTDLVDFFYGTGLIEHTVVRPPNPAAEKNWLARGLVAIKPLPFAGDDVFAPIEPPPGELMELEMTPAGGLPTGKLALTFFGELGNVVRHYKMWKKRGEFIQQLMDKVEGQRLHPDLKMHGAVTGRGSGGSVEADADSAKFSMQQLPKRPMWLDFYRLFKAAPGKKLLYLDFCLHPDTEVLTPSGWKIISELEEREMVWQVDKDSLLGEFVVPSRVINRDYEGPMYTISTSRGSLSVTEGHTMLYAAQQNQKSSTYAKKRYVVKAEDPIQSTYNLLTSSIAPTVSSFSKEELWTVCALQADGHNYGNTDRYTNKSLYSIEVSRAAKKTKCEELFGDRYTVRQPREYQTTSSQYWCSIQCNSELLKPGKLFDLSTLGTNQVEEFVNALAFWDGSTLPGKSGRIMWYTCNKHNAEEVQRYLITSGYEAKLRFSPPKKAEHSGCYHLSIRKQAGIRLRPIDKTVAHYSGKVTCVTVPSGFIQVRSGGQTFITGNCSLEDVLMAAASKDPTFMTIYGSEEPHDGYLYLAMQIFPEGKEAREVYYKNGVISADSVKEAKKVFKSLRNRVKPVKLGKNYGMGVAKLRASMQQSGIFMSHEEVGELSKNYDESVKGVQEWTEALEAEWHKRGGYILNGSGRPMCIPKKLLKDSKNRYIQSWGHDCLLLFVHYIELLRTDRDVPMRPYHYDNHDATVWEVDEAFVEDGVQIFKDALELMNMESGSFIELKGDVEVGETLADFVS